MGFFWSLKLLMQRTRIILSIFLEGHPINIPMKLNKILSSSLGSWFKIFPFLILM